MTVQAPTTSRIDLRNPNITLLKIHLPPSPSPPQTATPSAFHGGRANLFPPFSSSRKQQERAHTLPAKTCRRRSPAPRQKVTPLPPCSWTQGRPRTPSLTEGREHKWPLMSQARANNDHTQARTVHYISIRAAVPPHYSRELNILEDES